MATRFRRFQEVFEAVQYQRFNAESNQPEFDPHAEWVFYAWMNKLLCIDGEDLLWGHRALDRRIKRGYWIVKNCSTGALEFLAHTDFTNQFELYNE